MPVVLRIFLSHAEYAYEFGVCLLPFWIKWAPVVFVSIQFTLVPICAVQKILHALVRLAYHVCVERIRPTFDMAFSFSFQTDTFDETIKERLYFPWPAHTHTHPHKHQKASELIIQLFSCRVCAWHSSFCYRSAIALVLSNPIYYDHFLVCRFVAFCRSLFSLYIWKCECTTTINAFAMAFVLQWFLCVRACVFGASINTGKSQENGFFVCFFYTIQFGFTWNCIALYIFRQANEEKRVLQCD